MAKTLTNPKENYSAWYNEVIQAADMADHSPVRGCMIIKPYGYAIWENMQSILDKKFKATGHTNAYFPLLIPKRFFSKEASHVDGFAKECAIVTHYRLKNKEDGEGVVVDPDAKLEEELIIRPTSETIIWNAYKDWIKSYRDLPLLINQWANVMRWEMRTRPFLRTSEFLWQEGHTAHVTAEEAMEEALRMNNVYADFVENELAIPVIRGRKSESERFAGAVETYCIEALMRDGKALQAGTSHFLGQNFAKAFDVKFLNKDNVQEFVWATSWGVSTRLIGAVIMAHGDEKGLMLPPRIAPIQVVIITIYAGGKDNEQAINKYASHINDLITQKDIRSKIDNDTITRPGWKYAKYEMQGIPLRIAIGKRDMENKTVEIVRRDTGDKQSIPMDNLQQHISQTLKDIQSNMLKNALAFRDKHITKASNIEDLVAVLNTKGGFVSAYWDGNANTENQIKEQTKATIRCIISTPEEEKTFTDKICISSGQPAKHKVLFAIAY